MIIGQIGDVFKSIRKIDFNSKKSFFDFDVIFIDLNYICNEFRPSNNFLDSSSDSLAYVTVDFFYHGLERLKELINFKTIGKSIFFFTPIDQTYRYSPKHSDQITDYRLLEFIDKRLVTHHSEGSKIDIVNSKSKIGSFFEKHKAYLRYKAYFKNYSGHSLINISGTEQVVSFYKESLVFLPLFVGVPDEKKFISELIDTFQFNDTKKIDLPKWSEYYFLPQEKSLKIELDELINAKNDIEKKIEHQNDLINLKINQKTLLCGSGSELENEIELIFREIGFNIKEKQVNRDDLIVEYSNKVAVLEIKGVKSSAAEKHAAQLNKWVSTYYSENNTEPKGILLVNPYKDTELNNRNFEDFFPQQMLPYVKRMRFCLITSTQLLGLYFDLKKNPNKKDNLIKSLFSTVGVYPNYKDWRKYIEYKEAQTDSIL